MNLAVSLAVFDLSIQTANTNLSLNSPDLPFELDLFFLPWIWSQSMTIGFRFTVWVRKSNTVFLWKVREIHANVFHAPLLSEANISHNSTKNCASHDWVANVFTFPQFRFSTRRGWRAAAAAEATRHSRDSTPTWTGRRSRCPTWRTREAQAPGTTSGQVSKFSVRDGVTPWHY